MDSIRLTHTFSTLLLKDLMMWHELDKLNTAVCSLKMKSDEMMRCFSFSFRGDLGGLPCLKDKHVIVAGETGAGKSVYLSLWPRLRVKNCTPFP